MEETDPNEPSSPLKEIPGHIKDFIRTKLAYYKLVATEGTAGAVSGAILGILLLFFGLFFLIFLFVGLAIFIGQAIGSMGGGFLIVAGLFLLLAALAVLLRKPVITDPITKLIITNMAGGTSDEPNENK